MLRAKAEKSFLSIILFFLMISNGYCHKVKEIDTNKDGKTDKWFYTSNNKLMKLEEDFNFDGVVDKQSRFYYENGEKKRVDIDSNMDGKVDGRADYKEEKQHKIELDTNYDGETDYIINKSNGTSLIDSNYDGKMDIQQLPDRTKVDLDFDGTMDKDFTDAEYYDNWFSQNRPKFAENMSRYMENTNYK